MKPTITALLSLLLLTACGDTRIERAGSGAVIGGVVGGGIGAVCCADPLHGFGVGAAIGAASGAAIGAISNKPLFFNHESEYWPYDNRNQ